MASLIKNKPRAKRGAPSGGASLSISLERDIQLRKWCIEQAMNWRIAVHTASQACNPYVGLGQMALGQSNQQMGLGSLGPPADDIIARANQLHKWLTTGVA